MSATQLKKYNGSRGVGWFRPMSLDEVKTLSASHIWFRSMQGDAREAKVNGAVRTWKRDASRVELPLKYGMYEYATFTTRDILDGRVLVEVDAPASESEVAQ